LPITRAVSAAGAKLGAAITRLTKRRELQRMVPRGAGQVPMVNSGPADLSHAGRVPVARDLRSKCQYQAAFNPNSPFRIVQHCCHLTMIDPMSAFGKSARKGERSKVGRIAVII
jgi:hypothetical protein